MLHRSFLVLLLTTSPAPIVAVRLGRRAVLGAAAASCSPWSRWPAISAVPPDDPLCDPSVSILRSGAQQLVLVGTAHISEDSPELVRRVIRAVQPDTVMVELDAARAAKLVRPAAGAAPAPPTPAYGAGQLAKQLLRGDVGEAGAQAVGWGLSSLYRSLEGMGFQSGREFVVAVQEAERAGATVLLGDQDAQVTLRRLRDAVVQLSPQFPDRFAQRLAADPAMLGKSMPAELDRASVEATLSVLQQRNNVRTLTTALALEAPPLYSALIGDRDAYMAASIGASGARSVVAVVGLAHLDGIEARFQEQGARRDVPRSCAAASR